MIRTLVRSVALAVWFPTILTAESYVPWNKKNMREERASLCEAVEKEVIERTSRLAKETGSSEIVQFQFPEKERDKKSFETRWKSKRFTDEDVEGRWKDLLRLTTELTAKEAEARPKWQEKMKDRFAAEKAEKEGPIFGIKVKARKLGAILDRSPSMAKYLPALRKEIKHTFEDYPSVEIWGSFLNVFKEYQIKSNPTHSSSEDPWVDTRWFSMVPGDADDPFNPAWHFPAGFPVPPDRQHMYSIMAERDNVSAVLGMIELHKVDALYWFCDLKDDVRDEAVKRIAEVIEKNKVKLYIHTVGRKPKGLLDLLVKRSGGAITTDKPRVIPAEKPPVP